MLLLRLLFLSYSLFLFFSLYLLHSSSLSLPLSVSFSTPPPCPSLVLSSHSLSGVFFLCRRCRVHSFLLLIRPLSTDCPALAESRCLPLLTLATYNLKFDVCVFKRKHTHKNHREIRQQFYFRSSECNETS